MVGILKTDGRRYWVEYNDRHVQVGWSLVTPESAAKARRWIDEALPGLEKVPETMLRSVIGSHADFTSASLRKEKSVERHGALADGGSIKIVYFKNEPLSDGDYRDGVETLATWIRSYFS